MFFHNIIQLLFPKTINPNVIAKNCNVTFIIVIHVARPANITIKFPNKNIDAIKIKIVKIIFILFSSVHTD